MSINDDEVEGCGFTMILIGIGLLLYGYYGMGTNPSSFGPAVMLIGGVLLGFALLMVILHKFGN
jgi:formate/nitrite transporter FocA (FNT family)